MAHLEENKDKKRKRRPKFKRICLFPDCSKEFMTARKNQKYCSSECRLADYDETHVRVTVDEWEEFQKFKEGRS